MTSKNTIKISSILTIVVVGFLLLFFALRSQLPVFFPGEEKTIERRINDHNLEATIRIYLVENRQEDFELQVFEKGSTIDLEPDISDYKGRLCYSYRYLKVGAVYTIKIRNKTRSFIFTNIDITDND